MILEIRVQPRAKRDRIEVVDGPGLKVYVTATPINGKANDATLVLLAKALGVPKSSMAIVRGQKGRNKLLRLEGLTAHEVFARVRGQGRAAQ